MESGEECDDGNADANDSCIGKDIRIRVFDARIAKTHPFSEGDIGIYDRFHRTFVENGALCWRSVTHVTIASFVVLVTHVVLGCHGDFHCLGDTCGILYSHCFRISCPSQRLVSQRLEEKSCRDCLALPSSLS